ncbi:MAG: 3'-5' exoribonuclease [bacterium]|nr:3'-5' exoribonuclease [bacterium]
MTPNIMLDLETLGVGNDAAILSIGAVKFTDVEITDRFHVVVDPGSSQDAGLKIEAETIMWWLSEERAEARASLFEHQMVDLPSALVGFTTWVGGDGPIWGNGSTFDNVILRSAYRQLQLDYPGPFHQDYCYRTVKSLAPHIKLERYGLHHNAVDDAESQAKHLQEILMHLGRKPS